MELILTRKGYATVCAQSGAEALQRAREAIIDVALLDIRLPDVGGVELLAPLREIYPDIVSIMVTGYASVETAVHALNDGATAYLTKPLDIDRAIAMIESGVEKQRLITEKRQAEAALRESEARLRTVITNAPITLFALDNAGHVTFHAGKGFQTTDTDETSTAQEDLEHALAGIVRDERTGELSESVRRSLRGDTVASTEVVGDRTFEVTYTPLAKVGKGVQSVIGVAVDVSERVRLEAQLQQQERLAAVGQLAGGIAHDFNNFLTTIILYANLLMGSPGLQPDQTQFTQTITGEARRAAALVQQILDFSRRAMMKTEPVDLVAFINEVTRLLHRTLPENITLVVETTSGSCICRADPTRIQQVIMNLVINARDAMSRGGSLRIKLTKLTVAHEGVPPVVDMPAGKWLCLSVSDTGHGMSEEVQARLFEPFFTTKKPGQGTGLGLAQVYGIVRQHGGYINVVTAPGEGSTFLIYLPEYVGDPVEIDPVENLPQSLIKGRGETILLVEDQVDLRQGGLEALSALGYEVLAAANGREALEVLDRTHVDLVITDIVMPEMGGEALAAELAHRLPGTTILAITGYVLEHEIQSLKDAGFADVVHKPFDINVLGQVVHRVLASR